MEWPKSGLRIQDAADFIEKAVYEGFTPVFTDSMYCFRRLQEYFPLRFIATSRPIVPIGLTETKRLSGVAFMILTRKGTDCTTYYLQRSKEVVLDFISDFINTFTQWFSRFDKPSVDAVPVYVTDLAGFARIVRGEFLGESAIIIADNMDCLWAEQSRGDIHSAILIDHPAFLLAVSSLGVDEELQKAGKPALILLDRGGGECDYYVLTPKDDLNPRDNVLDALGKLLIDTRVIHTPLELVIKMLEEEGL